MIDQVLIGRTDQATYPPREADAIPTSEPTLNALQLLDEDEALISNLLGGQSWDGTTGEWSVTIAHNTLTRGTHDWQKGSMLWDWTNAAGTARYQDYRPVEFATYSRPDPMTHVQDVKDYMRLSGTDDDLLIAQLVDEGHGHLLDYLGCLIESAEETETIGVGRNQTFLKVRNRPVNISAGVTVTDPDGNEYDETAFHYDSQRGIFYTGDRYDERLVFEAGTWTVEYTGGLDLRNDWEAVRTALANAERMWTAFLYNHRDAGVKSLKDGDVSVSYDDDDGVPARVRAILDKYARPAV